MNKGLTVKELRKLAMEKKNKLCPPISTMNKKELLTYIYGSKIDWSNYNQSKYKQFNISPMDLTVKQLRKLAMEKKNKLCPPISTMNKKELLTYLSKK